LKEAVAKFEKFYISEHFKREKNVSELAKRLKMPRTTLISKLKRYDLKEGAK
jgi:transcriptional regulator with PAS, ATPase and Fis domain